MRDLHNHLSVEPAIIPQLFTGNTALVSDIIDLQGFNACEFAIAVGELADVNATFAVTMDHGDVSTLSDAAAVASDMLLGTLALASFTYALDGGSAKIGYVGDKRYVRLTITPSGNSGNATLSVLAILAHAHRSPVGNPSS